VDQPVVPAQPTPLGLADLAVSARTRLQLEDLAQRPPVASLVLLTGPGSRLAAVSLAHRLVSAPDVVRLAEPDSGRWQVADLAEQVFAPVSYAPHVRHVLVLTHASSLSSAQWDRLLKLFEEPPAPTWFLVECDRLDEVPAAIRGRAGQLVQVEPADAHERAAALVAAGVDAALAARLVSDAGPRIEADALVLAAGTDAPEVASRLAELLAAPASSNEPFAHARRLATQLDSLAGEASALVGSRPAAARLLCLLVLDVWQARMRGALAVADARSLPLVEAGLLRCDEAKLALDRNVPPAQVLAWMTLAVRR
jgi:hypothetical protein